MKQPLTIHLEDAAGVPAAGERYVLAPLAPMIDRNGVQVVGFAMAPTLDLAVGPEPVVGTLDANGEATVLLVPEDLTVKDVDGVGLRWRLTFGANAETTTTPHVTFGMPTAALRLDDVLPGASTP